MARRWRSRRAEARPFFETERPLCCEASYSALHAGRTDAAISRAPPLAVHCTLWTVVTLALTFALMPAVKGAVVGLQWALRMHGFDYAAQVDGHQDEE